MSTTIEDQVKQSMKGATDALLSEAVIALNECSWHAVQKAIWRAKALFVCDTDDECNRQKLIAHINELVRRNETKKLVDTLIVREFERRFTK